MPHGESELIASITISLAFAFAGGMLVQRLGQPPILGYLLAGIAVGPFTPGFTANAGLAVQLADIGLVLLMFGVGLQFNVRDLLMVRGIAIAGALGQTVAMVAVTAWVAVAMGWGLAAGLILGLAFSVASTVVAIRVLTDRGELDSLHGRIMTGWLIAEDLLTVIALVLIPPFVTGASDDPLALLAPLGLTAAKGAAFALLMVFVGARAVPWLLAEVARTGQRELFTLGVLAVALGIAVGATAVFGISLALGAFVAGVVVSESDVSHQAAADALPLRDAFAVLFFVSVGMLFDPIVLAGSPHLLFAALVGVVLLKPAFVLVIVSAFGYPPRTGWPIAAARAQIGEFSFILAGLGRGLGVLPEDGYNLIIATALLSIALNPLAFRVAGALAPRLGQSAELARFLRWRAGDLAQLPRGSDLRNHAVLCGHGRVGSVIARALDRRGFRYVAIDQNRTTVEDLRRRDVDALYGDASNPALLDHAGLATARILLIAVPDAPSVRLIIDHAHRVNPGIDIVARTHSEDEWRYLRDGRVDEAVSGERELAIEMARHALQRFGVSAAETLAITQGLRRGD